MTDDVRHLYHGPLEDFVARRTALAKERRPQDAAAAAAIAKLRKPSVTAWAVDQLAVTQPDVVAELLAAGADARDAQRAAADGAAGGDDLRDAMARVRHAVDTAARAALAGAANPESEESERRIRTTLQAAATGSAEQRLALWQGILERDVEPAGFAVTGADDDADSPEVAAAISSLRHTPRQSSPRRVSAVERDKAAHAADRAAARRAAELRDAATRARALANAKREQADRVGEAARIAVEEAAAAERAAVAAERAAEQTQR